MKAFTSILLAASATSAFVLPDEQLFAQIPVENEREQRHGLWDKLPSLDKITHGFKKPFKHVTENIPSHPLDAAISRAKHHCAHDKGDNSSPFDYSSWIEDSLQQFEAGPPHGHPDDHPHGPPSPPHHGPPPPHHDGPPPPHGPPGPPHHGPPGHGPPKEGRKGKHGKKGKKPHHRPGWWHHHKHAKPNQTIYELISKSNYTTNLTKIIDEDKDLVAKLNSTKANYTLFAPTNWAFKRIEEHLPDVPKAVVKKVLLYHILPDVYPSFKLLWSHTVPTLLEEDALGGHPQRVLAKWFGFIRGTRLNYYSRVLAANIPATNGLIHATSAILLPPPPALAIITHVPGTFSTLELGLIKTELFDTLNTTGKDTIGGTLFAPTNTAFKKLGPRANAFLFSKYGEKYLKALLSYHIVPERTLYSTAFYDGKKKSTKEFFTATDAEMKKCPHHNNNKDVKAESYVHLDLPTLLDEKPIAVDIIRRGPFVFMKLNAFVRVAVQDALAKDGVIQIVNSVLIPPKKPGAATIDEMGFYNGESEMSVEELKERLAPFVESVVDKEVKWDL